MLVNVMLKDKRGVSTVKTYVTHIEITDGELTGFTVGTKRNAEVFRTRFDASILRAIIRLAMDHNFDDPEFYIGAELVLA